MSPNLQALLDRLQHQLDSMSQEEYEEQLTLIDQMNDGPTADDLIRSFHEPSGNYSTTNKDYYNIVNPTNQEYTPSGKDYSLAA